MNSFQVSLCVLKDQSTLASYVHPLSKRKIRKTFISGVEADEYKKRIENQLNRTDFRGYRDFTLEDLTILFLNENPKNSFFKMRIHLMDFIETFGHLKMDDITPDKLRAWLDLVQQENKISDTTMNSLKCNLDRLFKFLEEKEIISESPLREIYYQKMVPALSSRNILSEAEIENLLYAAKQYAPGYFYPILRLFAETAAKVNEVIDLTWKQLDLDKRTVHFLGTDKSQERKIPISQELCDILRHRRRETGIVFQTHYREPFTQRKLSILINEFKRQGLYKRNWNLMDLRHSLAVNYLGKGGNIRDLQVILGHANVFDTKKLYEKAKS